MAGAEKLREYILDEYGEHFDAWLVDLKKNQQYIFGFRGRLRRGFDRNIWKT